VDEHAQAPDDRPTTPGNPTPDQATAPRRPGHGRPPRGPLPKVRLRKEPAIAIADEPWSRVRGRRLDPTKGLRLKGETPQRTTVYVGDTRGDEKATAEAGMEFAFVRYGFGEASAPSLAFDSFGELVAHFLACRPG
jgi:hypothetical protein